MSLGKFSALVSVILTLCGVVWYFAVQDVAAGDQAEEQETLVEAVKVLTAIHVRQATVQEAEQAMTVMLCAQGKLKGADCVATR